MAKRKVCAKCHSSLEKQPQEETSAKSKINIPIVWILGGPGSGKGVQADKITEKYGFCHVSAGCFLAREIRSRISISKSLLRILESGNLAPTDIVLQGIKQEIYENLANAKGFVIDGYPNTREQDMIFVQEIGSPALILFLDVPSEVLVSRLLARAKVSGRDDDNYASVQKRLQIHYDTKDSLLIEFEEKIKIINADRPPGDVFEDIKKYIIPLVN